MVNLYSSFEYFFFQVVIKSHVVLCVWKGTKLFEIILFQIGWNLYHILLYKVSKKKKTFKNQPRLQGAFSLKTEGATKGGSRKSGNRRTLMGPVTKNWRKRKSSIVNFSKKRVKTSPGLSNYYSCFQTKFDISQGQQTKRKLFIILLCSILYSAQL